MLLPATIIWVYYVCTGKENTWSIFNFVGYTFLVISIVLYMWWDRQAVAE